jgi:hypothetical protein
MQLGDLVVRIIGDEKPLIGTVDRLGKDPAAGRAGTRVGQMFANAVTRRADIIGSVLGAGIAEGINASAQFADQLATIETVTGRGVVALEGLDRGALKLSADTGKPIEDITSGMYDLVSAGIPASQVLDTLAASSNLAIGGLGSVADAVDVVSSALNAYGPGVYTATQVTDIFAKAVADGKITTAELGSSIATIAPIAAQAGVSLEEVSAGFAALTAKGVPATEAATQMRSAIVALISPNETLNNIQASTGINFAKLAKEKGLAVALEELRRVTTGLGDDFDKFEAPASAVFDAIAQGSTSSEEAVGSLVKLGKTFGLTEGQAEKLVKIAGKEGAGKAFAELRTELGAGDAGLANALGRVEALNFTLASTGPNAAAFAQQVVESTNSAGLAAEQAAIKMDSPVEAGKRLAAQFKVMSIEVFGPFADSLGPAVVGLNHMGGALGALLRPASLVGGLLGNLAGRVVRAIVGGTPAVIAAGAAQGTATGTAMGTAAAGSAVATQAAGVTAGQPVVAATATPAAVTAGSVLGRALGLAAAAAAIAVPIVIGVAATDILSQPVSDPRKERNRQMLEAGVNEAIKDGKEAMARVRAELQAEVDSPNLFQKEILPEIQAAIAVLDAEMSAVGAGVGPALGDGIEAGTPDAEAALDDFLTGLSAEARAALGPEFEGIGSDMAADVALGFKDWAASIGEVIPALEQSRSSTDGASKAIGRQVDAIDRVIERTEARDAAEDKVFGRTMRRLASEQDAQLAALDLADRQAAIAERRRDINERLNDAQEALSKAQGGSDAQAISDAMANLAKVQADQAANEEQVTEDELRARLEGNRDYINDVARLTEQEDDKRSLSNTLRRREDVLAGRLAVAQSEGDAAAVADITARLEAVRTALARTEQAVRARDRVSDLEVQKAQLQEHLANVQAAATDETAVNRKKLADLQKAYATYLAELEAKTTAGSVVLANGFNLGLTTPMRDAHTAAIALDRFIRDDLVQAVGSLQGSSAADILAGILELLSPPRGGSGRRPPSRQYGGRVLAGEPFIANEVRQEAFVSDRNGTVLPSLEVLAGGGGPETIIVESILDGEVVARSVARRLEHQRSY